MLDIMAMSEWHSWKKMPLQIGNPTYRTSPMRSGGLKHGSHSYAQPEVHGHHQTRRGMEVPLMWQGVKSTLEVLPSCYSFGTLALQSSAVPSPGCGGAFCWRISSSPPSSWPSSGVLRPLGSCRAKGWCFAHIDSVPRLGNVESYSQPSGWRKW